MQSQQYSIQSNKKRKVLYQNDYTCSENQVESFDLF